MQHATCNINNRQPVPFQLIANRNRICILPGLLRPGVGNSVLLLDKNSPLNIKRHLILSLKTTCHCRNLESRKHSHWAFQNKPCSIRAYSHKQILSLASRKVAAVVVLVVDPPVIVFYDSAPTPSRPQTLRRILDHPKTWSDERNQPRAHRS